MSRVVAQSDGLAIGRADAALSAENQKLLSIELRRIPAHPGILTQANNIAARMVQEQLFRQRQTASWAGCLSLKLVNLRRIRTQNWVVRAHEIIEAPNRLRDQAGSEIMT